MSNGTSINILRQRSSGILLPLFSLPGPLGIGDLGPAARQFVDFLHNSGQSCWQILPVGPTSPMFGNSPYMSCSAFAGNPLLISVDDLLAQGWVRTEEISECPFSEYQVDYPRVAAKKAALLGLAWRRFQALSSCGATLRAFAAAHPWVADYGLFMALKERYHQQPWYDWPVALRNREPAACAQARSHLHAEIDAYLFEQYLFFTQWHDFRAYAHGRNIHLIGDLPIYVALDSADVWANQTIFQLEAHTCQPTHVAGVPPDYFSVTGQRWGNPLYRWGSSDPAVRERLWNWWEERLRLNFTLVDTLRVDHFRGFASYWAVPAEEETALKGQWRPGPGQPFFEEMDRRLGGMSIIAEDLGHITPDVESLRRNLEYPGMKILLFAFDGDPNNSYLPYNTEKDSVMYTGTHDNDTAVGWYLSPDVDPAAKQRAKRFANRQDDHAGSFHQELMHLALSSPANLVILPLQDVLGFGNDCRMNTPGTTENNWQWRCAERFVTDDVARWLADLTGLFGRVPQRQPSEADVPSERKPGLGQPRDQL
jgi:4-alpha-glucanotransferase